MRFPWILVLCISAAIQIRAQISKPNLEAKTVKVIFTADYHPPDTSADTIYYSPERPLTWKDFTGKPRYQAGDAAVSYTSFGYIGHSRQLHDTALAYLTLQVFFVKSASWVIPSVESSSDLSHEQLHFDLTELSALHFREMVLTDTLLSGDYSSRIQYLFLDGFRYMDSIQEQYDEETGHGTNEYEQEKWKKEVSIKLKEIGLSN